MKKLLIITGALAILACSAPRHTPQQPAVTLQKPWEALEASCKTEKKTVICPINTFRDSIIGCVDLWEIAALSRATGLEAAELARLDRSEIEGKLAAANHRADTAENSKYRFAGGGVLIGIACTLLGVLFFN